MTEKPEQPAAEDLKRFEDLAVACNRCGFCTSYCPTYNATGKESHSPRGRNQTFRALMEGRLADPASAKESIDTCLLCGECTSVCFSEVPTAELMRHARAHLNRRLGLPKPLRFFFEKILPYPRRFAWALRLGFWAKAAGFSWLLKKTGLLQKFAPAMAAADDLLRKAPTRFLLDHPYAKTLRESARAERGQALAIARHKAARQGNGPAAPVTTRAQVGYFPACGSQYIRPSAGLATLDLLRRLRIDVAIAESICCGLPAASYGANDKVVSMAKVNLRHWESARYETILVDDTSCAAHLKDYPKFMPNDGAALRVAHEQSQRVRDLSSFFLQRGIKDLLRFAKWTGGPVAFHDPCKAQYGLRLTSAPREILSTIPNLKLVPITDADQCCGGGGTFSVAHAELSKGVLASKVRNVAASGCRIVVTTSISCLVQLESGLRDGKPRIEALHLSEFLVRALDRKS